MDDPDPGNLIFQIILLFVLILLNAFFAMSEIAIISLNDTKIAKMAEEGNKKAKQVLQKCLKYLNQPICDMKQEFKNYQPNLLKL